MWPAAQSDDLNGTSASSKMYQLSSWRASHIMPVVSCFVALWAVWKCNFRWVLFATSVLLTLSFTLQVLAWRKDFKKCVLLSAVWCWTTQLLSNETGAAGNENGFCAYLAEIAIQSLWGDRGDTLQQSFVVFTLLIYCIYLWVVSDLNLSAPLTVVDQSKRMKTTLKQKWCSVFPWLASAKIVYSIWRSSGWYWPSNCRSLTKACWESRIMRYCT